MEHPESNVGVLLGQASGLVVVDIDGPEGEEWFDRKCLEHGFTGITYSVATGKGVHYYFTHDRPLRKFRPNGDQGQVEVLADGQQVCAAPSIHPSGRTYTVLTSGVEPLPLPTWLLDYDPKASESAFDSSPETPAENEEADVFYLQDYGVTQTPTKVGASPSGRLIEIMERELQSKCGELAATPIGGRNNRLNDLACRAGNRIGSDLLDRSRVESDLTRAGVASGLGRSECAATIRSGIERGLLEPYTLKTSSVPTTGQRRPDRKSGATVEWMHLVADERPEFLWGHRIVRNSVTLLAGDSGLGKSQIALEVIRSMTGNGGLPDDKGQVIEAGRVMYVSFEDGPVLGYRLTRAGIDRSKVARVSGPRDEHGNPTAFRVQDIESLRENIAEAGDIRLLIIDPWANLLIDDNPNSSEAQLAALEPLLRLAEQDRITVLIICHIRKSREGAAKDWVAGNKALTNNVRSGIMASRLDDGTCTLHHFKSNWSREALALSYQIDSDDNDEPLFNWLGESKVSLDDLARPRKLTKEEECRTWLRDHAFRSEPEIRSKDLEEDAKAEGFSSRTLERAKKGTVDSRKAGEVWWCKLVG